MCEARGEEESDEACPSWELSHDMTARFLAKVQEAEAARDDFFNWKFRECVADVLRRLGNSHFGLRKRTTLLEIAVLLKSSDKAALSKTDHALNELLSNVQQFEWTHGHERDGHLRQCVANVLRETAELDSRQRTGVNLFRIANKIDFCSDEKDCWGIWPPST
jgi:hypothetical protein